MSEDAYKTDLLLAFSRACFLLAVLALKKSGSPLFLQIAVGHG